MLFCYDYMLFVEIIFSLLKSCSVEIGENHWRDIYRRGLRPQEKVRCFWILETETDLRFLNALTNLIVRVWSTGGTPFVLVEHQVPRSTNWRQNIRGACPINSSEVNRQEHLSPTMGLDKTWSHPHLRLSFST